MKENYCGYYINSTAKRVPEGTDWKPCVTIRWEEQFRVQQLVFETSHFARTFATQKEAEKYGHAAIRKWLAAGRPIVAPSTLL
jgi:hypothetical protein